MTMTEDVGRRSQFSLATLFLIAAVFAIGFATRNIVDGMHPFYVGLTLPASTSPVRAGERLGIECFMESRINHEALVLADGTVNLPLVGIVDINGQTTTQIEAVLSKQYSKQFGGSLTVQVFRIQSR